MENLRVCGNCKHWLGSGCSIYPTYNVSEKEKACDKFEMKNHIADDRKKVEDDIVLKKCGDCIHYANRDCPVGDGNTTADHTCECAFFYLSANGGKMVSDNVNHPSHYTAGGIECIEALKAATVGLEGIEAVCTANAIKYMWRWKHKNGVEDINKAIWYLERLKKEISDEQPVP